MAALTLALRFLGCAGMGFAGNLRTLSLGEVFQTIGRIQGTGVLRLTAEVGGRDVVFDNGTIIGVAFRAGERKQALLKRLILQGKLDAHSAASLSSTGSESQVVKAVIDQGWVTTEDVNAAYEQQAREELESLASWEYADFIFEDAVPDQPLAMKLVARYREMPINIDMSHLLIESARRSDEWLQLHHRIPDENAIFAPAPNAHAALQRYASEYPASAVAPLIDGVRTVAQVCAESVSSRLDVYAIIVQMLDQRLVLALEPQQIQDTADQLVGTLDFSRASALYRLLIEKNAGSEDVGDRLAGCLEHLSDPNETSSTLTALARLRLDAKDPDQAEQWAERAVEIAPDRADARLGLARCLISQRKLPEAIRQLHFLTKIYTELGKLEEARATCLKVLSLDPQEEEARRDLARIFSHADKEERSPDVVVCVRCGQVNHREASHCEKCRTALQLDCLACGKVVSVSDKLCIFCGADPHAGVQRAPAAGRPATERFLATDRIAVDKRGQDDAWKGELAAALQAAREAEDSDRLTEALAAWHKVATFQADPTEVQGRIREIEHRLGLRHVDENIQRGHELRSQRRFWRAAKCYRDALRVLPPEDPRAAPLQEILATTERWHRRNASFYIAALVVLAVLGTMVLLVPYLQLRGVQRDFIDLKGDISAASNLGVERIQDVTQRLFTLKARAERIHGRQAKEAAALIAELEGDLEQVKVDAARRDLHEIQGLLAAGDFDAAATGIALYNTVFPDLLPQQVRTIEAAIASGKKHKSDAAVLAKEAPARLAKAQAMEKSGALADALAAYRALSDIPDAKIAPAVVEAIARLQAQEQAIIARLNQIKAAEPADLAAADAAFAAAEPACSHWGQLADQVKAERARLVALAKAATEAYAALGDKPADTALAAFVDGHPGTPEAATAATRLKFLREQIASRSDLRHRYDDAISAHRWQDAWQAAKDLATIGETNAPMPLAIQSIPPGAAVRVGGREAGITPCLALVQPGAGGDLSLSLDGWHTLAVPLAEAARSWQVQAELVRQERWKLSLRHPATTVLQLGQAVFASSSEMLQLIDPAGSLRWSCAVPHGSDDISDSRAKIRLAPVALANGAIAVALADHGVALLDAAGRITQELATTQPVRGHPVLYTNDLIGDKPRLAYAAESLFAANIGEDPVAIPLTSPALGGPVVVARDLERVLAVIDVRGHLLGFEESTKAPCWDLDLEASDCGQLLPLVEGEAITVLDGSRVIALALGGAKPSVRWSHPLNAPVVGDPVVAGAGVVVASGESVLRLDASGAVTLQIALGGPASCQPAVSGEEIAIGRLDGHLLVYHGERLRWSTALSAPATAVGYAGGALVVATADGALAAYAP